MRRARAIVALLALALGAATVGPPSAAAEDGVPDGAFPCADAAPADARLTSLALTPELVPTGPGVVSVVFGLHEDLQDPPVVNLASRDGGVSFTAAALADPSGWRADLTLPSDAPPAELGVTIVWADGQVSPCGLRARQLPSVVALRPVLPASPSLTGTTPGDGQVVLAWTRGADGDAPLTGYRVVAHPGGQTYDVSDPAATGAVLPGLTDGTPYTFDVSALTAAGASPVVTSAAVVPRRRLVLGSVTLAARAVTYGGTSSVTATVRTVAGEAVEGVDVELYARRAGTSTWGSVARARSGPGGLVVLRAVLTGASSLAVVHAPDASLISPVAAGEVMVAARVTATAPHAVAPAAYRQQVTGNLSPGGPVGSPVRLQRYVGGSWQGVAGGTLVTATSYAVRWTPQHAGRYRLRVLRAALGAVGSGVSPTFTVDVFDTRISVAREVLADAGTRLATTHTSGVLDRATARDNLLDTAAGRAARRSTYQGAPGGSVLLDLRTLRLLRRIGRLASVSVTEVAGGSHSGSSAHYLGRGLDVSVVNGAPVRRGSAYLVVVRACQAAGATQVFSPSYDPYGGHQTHVHCAFV